MSCLDAVPSSPFHRPSSLEPTRWWLAALALAALSCTGCVEDLAEHGDVRVVQAPVIFGKLDWRDLWEWGHPDTSGGKDKRVVAHYGKSVVAFFAENNGTTPCTGFLVNDRQVMTNKHCADNNATVAALIFGRWAQNMDQADLLAGAYAKSRLIQMGYDSGRVQALPDPIPPQPSDLAFFGCRSGVQPPPSFTDARFGKRQFQVSEFGRRDVSMWTCTPQVLPILGVGGDPATIDPGMIWGHVRLNYDRPPPGAPDVLADALIGQVHVKDGTDTDVVGHNRSRSSDIPRNLLSPVGQVLDARDSCEDLATKDFKDHCFEHDNDTFSGHSGAPVFADGNHVVFGLNHGASLSECEADIHETYHSRYWNQNLGTYIPHVDDLLPFPFGLNLFPESSAPPTDLSWIGGQGGELFEADCPVGFRAIGLVGASDTLESDEENRALGMFGLVCGPMSVTDMTVGPNEQPPALRPMDVMVALAGGSRDTLHAPGVLSLNRLLNESPLQGELDLLVAPELYAAQLRMHLCPPSMFLKSVTARASTVVHAIDSIVCSNAAGSRLLQRRPVDNIRLGQLTGGTTHASECPDGELVSGISIRSGWVTDGYSLRCRSRATP